MPNILKLTHYGKAPDSQNLVYLSKACLNHRTVSDKILLNKTLSKNEVLENYEKNLNLFKKILPTLTQDLNHYHGVNYSIKFWSTVVGWWLLDHIKIHRDIYKKLQHIDKKRISNYLHFNFSYDETRLYNFEDSIEKFKDDQWNQFAHQRAMNYFFPFIKKTFIDKKKIKPKINYNNFIKKILNYIIYLYNYLLTIFFLDKIVFLNHYFDFQISKKIFFSLKTIPILKYYYTNEGYLNFINYDLDKRLNNFINFKPKDDFEDFYYNVLKKDLPIALLENFNQVLKSSIKKYNYKKFDIVVTSQSHFFDTSFKISIAYFREIFNLKLFIIQHGGSYFFGNMDVHLYWEKNIADLFLTWGTFPNKENIKFLGQNRIKKINNNPEYILVILDEINRNYSCYMTPDSNDLLDYLDDVSILINKLSEKFKVIVRLPKHNQFYKKYLIKKNKDLIFDKNSNSFESYKKSSLVISCAFATSALETISNNIPTIVYIPKKMNYFDFNLHKDELLKEIYFDNYQQILNKLLSNSFSAYDWWNQNYIKNLIKNFLKKYCYTNENIVKDFKKYFTNVF